MERKGNLLQFTHALMLFWKNGKTLEVVRKGNTDRPFTLVITKQEGEYKVTVDGKVFLEHRDASPLPSNQRVSIGGYLSRLHLRSVSIQNLDKSKTAEK